VSKLHRVCWLGALVGVVLGVSGVAWQTAAAQDPAAQAAVVGEVDLWLRLLQSGGLPAVFGFLGYWVPRALSNVKITITLEAPEGGLLLRLDPGQLDELADALESRRRGVRPGTDEVA
jgi:hypothetical protein